jgi:hypothetical protein
MSPTPVVAAAGPTASNPQGARHRRLPLRWWPLPDLLPALPGDCHRRLQLQWWPMPDLLLAPPRGPSSTSATLVVIVVRPVTSTPGGPPSMSPSPVVAAAGPATSIPQGARHQRLQLWWWPLSDLPLVPPTGSAIDVFNLSGGRCGTCRQHLPGGLLSTFHSTWYLPPEFFW